jgi:hypothetical protein
LDEVGRFGVVSPYFTRLAILNDSDWVEVLPRALRSMADAPNCGAEEKIGHSGRDDKTGKRKPKNTAMSGCATGSWPL